VTRLFAALSLVVASALGGSAMAIEEPAYEVVRTTADFELRRYAPYLVAEVEVEGTFADAGNLAFRNLFRYISGANRPSTKIEMTAPVTQAPAGEGVKIPMTAPVTQTPSEAVETGRHVVAFVMPASFTRETLPEPLDPRVRIREVPARLVAAHRYSGTWSEARYRAHEQNLLDAIRREGLEPVAAPIFARYNSPFALWFMRRNEVLVEVAERPEP
jgi:hypothetical protein